MMAPKAPYLPSGTVLHTSRGRSPQPVREASAGPGQNPGSPGPKGPAAGSTLTPVRACQPSGIPASTGPNPGPDPDRAERRLNPQAPKGLVHKKSAPRVGFLCYADSSKRMAESCLKSDSLKSMASFGNTIPRSAGSGQPTADSHTDSGAPSS